MRAPTGHVKPCDRRDGLQHVIEDRYRRDWWRCYRCGGTFRDGGLIIVRRGPKGLPRRTVRRDRR